MKQLIVGFLFLGFLSSFSFAQQPFTAKQFPKMHFTDPELATQTTGRTSSATFSDALVTGDEANQFFVYRIWWWEKGDKPCKVTVTFANINDRQIRRQVLVPVPPCPSTSRPKILEIEGDGLERRGMASSLGVCLRNSRVKGLKAELLEIQGRFEDATVGNLQVKRFVPNDSSGFVGVGSPLGQEPGGRTGEQDMLEIAVKRTNCRKKDWQPFASCNPGNRAISRAVTGVRLFFNGTTFEGLKPFCSKVRVAE